MKKVIKQKKHPTFLNDIKAGEYDKGYYGGEYWWFCDRDNLIFENEDGVVLFKQGIERYLQCPKCSRRLTCAKPEYFEEKYLIKEVKND